MSGNRTRSAQLPTNSHRLFELEEGTGTLSPVGSPSRDTKLSNRRRESATELPASASAEKESEEVAMLKVDAQSSHFQIFKGINRF